MNPMYEEAPNFAIMQRDKYHRGVYELRVTLNSREQYICSKLVVEPSSLYIISDDLPHNHLRPHHGSEKVDTLRIVVCDKLFWSFSPLVNQRE